MWLDDYIVLIKKNITQYISCHEEERELVKRNHLRKNLKREEDVNQDIRVNQTRSCRRVLLL